MNTTYQHGTTNQDIAHLAAAFARSGKDHAVYLIDMTPEQANFLLQNCLYEQQRTRNKAHVNEFAYLMGKGEFRSYSDIECAVLSDGRMALIDGQHRLAALAKQSASFPFCLHLDRSEDSSDVRIRYDRFDSTVRIRRVRDLIRGMNDEIGFVQKDSELLSVATKAIHSGFVNLGSSASTAKRIDARTGEFVRGLMRDWQKEARVFFDIYHASNSPDRRYFHRANVMGIALVTIRYQQLTRKADEFWMKAMFDDGLRNGEPEKTLLNWFRLNKDAPPVTQARACSAGWNAYYENRKLVKIHVGSDKSLTILGTPMRIGSAV